MRKKYLLLFLLLAFTAAGCIFAKSTPAMKEPVLVGFINLSNDHVFSSSVQTAFARLVDKNPDIHVEYLNGGDDPDIQNQHIHNLIGKDAKAIVLMTTDSLRVLPALQEANEAGIPVITLTSRSLGIINTYVGAMDYDAGWKQGKYMLTHLSSGAKIVYLSGPQSIPSAQQRLQGFTDACLLRRNDFQLTAFAEAPYSARTKASEIMEAWLKQGIKPDAVVAASDELAIGAWLTLQDAGYTDVLISGINATPVACRLVKEGAMAQTVYQSPTEEAQGIYDVLLKLLQDKNLHPHDVIIPFVSVTKENVDDFLETP